MKNIFLFPGQGAQFQGMMMDLYESSSMAKKTIDKFSEISGENIVALLRDTDISVLNVVMDVLMEMDFGILFDMISGSDLTRVAFITYLLSILFIIVAAVFAILNIPFDAVSCSPKGFKRNITLSSCGIGFTVLSIISFLVFNSQLTSTFGAMYSGNIGFGSFLVILGFVAIIVVNILIKKKNVPVKYKDLSEYVERMERRRAEIAEMEEKAALAKEASKA